MKLIKATIQEGKHISTRSYKYLTVKDIHCDMRQKYGRALTNSHYVKDGKLVITWHFPKASVTLEGCAIHCGYRTRR